jgi:uncharacterized surface protein with fasciclin (FAS1) repeats
MNFRQHGLMAVAVATLISLTACANSPVASTPATVALAAAQTPELSTFQQLVAQAGLTDTLNGSGPLTVFAPSDAAFKALPAATMDKLSKDPALLKSVLTFHIVPGAIQSSDIKENTQFTTLQGTKVTVSKAGDFITIEDGLVTTANLPAGNGVVHVIDSVLMPPKK